MVRKFCYQGMDHLMCMMMNGVQWYRRGSVCSQEALENYLEQSLSYSRDDFFSVEPLSHLRQVEGQLLWDSPYPQGYESNLLCYADFFPATFSQRQTPHNQEREGIASLAGPTVILLHSLMSASRFGYRRVAARINSLGWNVIFPHLPFHYERSATPLLRGSLAITPDLVHTAETVRQGVKEVRQLIRYLRTQGDAPILLLGTSYGGWIASLLLSLERLEAAFLLQPIVDLAQAAFLGPLSSILSPLLTAQGITKEKIERHATFTSPLSTTPHPDTGPITLIGGKYDRVSPPAKLKECAQKWPHADYHEVTQGHFGYRVMGYGLELMRDYFFTFSR